jgi:hypothetical protein
MCSAAIVARLLESRSASVSAASRLVTVIQAASAAKPSITASPAAAMARLSRTRRGPGADVLRDGEATLFMPVRARMCARRPLPPAPCPEARGVGLRKR